MEIPTISSILTAAIMSITGLVCLAYYTTYWSNLFAFYAGIFLLIFFFAAWTVIMTKFGKVTKSASLRTTDFAVIAVFVALYVVADYAIMFFPGPLATIPWVIALTRYIPTGIMLAAFLKIVPKPGAAFTYQIGKFLIGAVVTTPNLLWLPRFILSAFALEAYYLTSKRGTLSSLLLMGLSLGIFLPAINALNWIAVYEYWQPLLITLPTAILCGITTAIGASIGYGIGSRAVRITL